MTKVENKITSCCFFRLHGNLGKLFLAAFVAAVLFLGSAFLNSEIQACDHGNYVCNGGICIYTDSNHDCDSCHCDYGECNGCHDCACYDDDCHHHDSYQCSDGIDNDGDGLIDISDSGCSSIEDNDETNSAPPPPPPPPPLQCSDGLDNDGDGLIDLADPGCSNSDDNDEINEIPPPQCSDGIDNDGDGKIDMDDPGCSDSQDNDEIDPVVPPPVDLCLNLDGVQSEIPEGYQMTECGNCVEIPPPPSPPPAQCGDGIDNDGDGLIDMADPGCSSIEDNDENFPPTITLLGDNPMNIFVNTIFTDPGATSTDSEDGDISANIIIGGDTVSTSTIGTYIISYNIADSKGATASTTRIVNVNPIPSQCSDGIDNDGDGKIDMDDLGCSDSQDNDEINSSGGSDGSSGGNGGSSGGGGSNGPPLTGGGGLTAPIVPSQSGGTPQNLGAASSPSQCNYLLEYLKIGANNNPAEVRKLQIFLKNFEGFTDLEVTGVFDKATFGAVSVFQNKYKSDILEPWGHDKPTGYVYITTKKKVNEIYCQTEFPLTLAQEKEISNFRNYLATLKTEVGTTEPLYGEIGQKTEEKRESAIAVSNATATPNLAGINISELQRLAQMQARERLENKEGGANLFAAAIGFFFGNKLLSIFAALTVVLLLLFLIILERRRFLNYGRY